VKEDPGSDKDCSPLQVRAAHDCAALLCGRRNTCNGEIKRREKIFHPKQLCGFLIFATLREIFLIEAWKLD
jgi:hypothetical protein